MEAQPQGPLMIGGFSAEVIVAVEVCRQLGTIGRKVDGLVVIVGRLFLWESIENNRRAVELECKTSMHCLYQ